MGGSWPAEVSERSVKYGRVVLDELHEANARAMAADSTSDLNFIL